MKHDIENREDIREFVFGFYNKVRKDNLLSPVFAANITDSAWPTHLQRMVAFWSAVLFADKGFEGNPMQKHFSLPVNEHHFTQWLLLFRQTIDELFAGPKAEEAKKRAASIAEIMLYKIQMLKP